jgi:hypothetical protein
LLVSTFEEVKTEKIDVVGKLLDLDDISERNPVSLTLWQLFLPVEVAGRIVLLVKLPLIQVVVLKEHLAYRQI